ACFAALVVELDDRRLPDVLQQLVGDRLAPCLLLRSDNVGEAQITSTLINNQSPRFLGGDNHATATKMAKPESDAFLFMIRPSGGSREGPRHRSLSLLASLRFVGKFHERSTYSRDS
ncbi:MAG: hypothetical protein AAGF11_43180, partial [Myxococcota bacterium]